MLQLFFLLFPSSGNFLFSILRTNMEMHCRMKHVIRIYLSFTAEPILPPSAHFVLFRAKSTDDSSKLLIAFKNPLPFFLTPQLKNGFVRLYLKPEAIFKLQSMYSQEPLKLDISLLSDSATSCSLNKQEINCPARALASTGD